MITHNTTSSNPDNPTNLPLVCWDVFLMSVREKLGNKLPEEDFLYKLQSKHNWNINLSEVLEQPYEALVLTDHEQVIRWVNSGFSKMTGYSSIHALGKTPRFLQGDETCTTTKRRIGKQLKDVYSFTEKIVNYRRDGSIYNCQITIQPLQNSKSETTHFLALETELNY